MSAEHLRGRQRRAYVATEDLKEDFNFVCLSVLSLSLSLSLPASSPLLPNGPATATQNYSTFDCPVVQTFNGRRSESPVAFGPHSRHECQLHKLPKQLKVTPSQHLFLLVVHVPLLFGCLFFAASKEATC